MSAVTIPSPDSAWPGVRRSAAALLADRVLAGTPLVRLTYAAAYEMLGL